MSSTLEISDYSYDLQDDRIAKYPLRERESSKLLVCERGKLSHHIFRELPDLIPRDTLMVFNETKVIQARLAFRKNTGAKVEIFCLEPHDPADYNLAFQKTSASEWKCLVGNARRWKEGPLELELEVLERKLRLQAEKTGRDKDAFIIRFVWDPGEIPFGRILEEAGTTPIPPYLKREAVSMDKETYQTVYSSVEGSVAAPTAGLHFTERMLDEIRRKGIPSVKLTLHIGAGTFRPVIAKSLSDHPMHMEHFCIGRRTLETLLNHRGKILAVGTTTTRVLETVYRIGNRLMMPSPVSRQGPPFFLDQWEAYQLPGKGRNASLEQLVSCMDKNQMDRIEGSTRLMIVPGYEFGMVDLLLTNFHQPGSTLLLLVAAFIGKNWRRAYDYALRNDFRFLSYGDSSLLIS